tara:strand:- start:230 stop:445 length:216 start_codon:yes stop_codon:yes gene_type:complete
MQLNNEEVEKEQLTKYQLLIQLKTLYKITDKLEQRIATLEKVIGKLQLRLGDVVLYIDKRGEENELERSNN